MVKSECLTGVGLCTGCWFSSCNCFRFYCLGGEAELYVWFIYHIALLHYFGCFFVRVFGFRHSVYMRCGLCIPLFVYPRFFFVVSGIRTPNLIYINYALSLVTELNSQGLFNRGLNAPCIFSDVNNICHLKKKLGILGLEDRLNRGMKTRNRYKIKPMKKLGNEFKRK